MGYEKSGSLIYLVTSRSSNRAAVLEGRHTFKTILLLVNLVIVTTTTVASGFSIKCMGETELQRNGGAVQMSDH